MLCSIEIILWISISNVEKDIFVSDVKSFGINFKVYELAPAILQCAVPCDIL